MHRLSDIVERKFVESHTLADFDILSDSGWEAITDVHKTVEYDVWQVTTSTGKVLECADTHILMTPEGEEVFAQDALGIFVQTTDGPDQIVRVVRTDRCEHMFDVTVDSENHTYYTNDILSHNTTTIAGIMLWHLRFIPEYNVALLAHKEAQSMEILTRLKFMAENLPPWMQIGVKTWNKKTIQFEPIDGEGLGEGSSAIAAATSSGAIRGLSLNCVDGSTSIKLRNKLTGEVVDTTIEEARMRMKMSEVL